MIKPSPTGEIEHLLAPWGRRPVGPWRWPRRLRAWSWWRWRCPVRDPAVSAGAHRPGESHGKSWKICSEWWVTIWYMSLWNSGEKTDMLLSYKDRRKDWMMVVTCCHIPGDGRSCLGLEDGPQFGDLTFTSYHQLSKVVTTMSSPRYATRKNRVTYAYRLYMSLECQTSDWSKRSYIIGIDGISSRVVTACNMQVE